MGRIERIMVQFDMPTGESYANWYKQTPLPGADVQEKMRLAFKTMGGHRLSYSIPAFNADYSTLAGMYRKLDFDNVAVKDFVNFHYLALPFYNYGIADRRDDLVVEFESSKQKFTER